MQTLRNVILGTAGHIDHGKTSLVRALTGVDTDRLPEEQRRGMTIELGFADFTEADVHFGLVDVPGHEKFVRTMVAGATGIDLALLVVAADDSVMPQTVEHVEILDLLGMKFGAVALTKVDMVDPSLVELATDEVRHLLASTSLSEFPIVPVSSVTGYGLPELRSALVKQAGRAPDRSSSGLFRLGVDRVFIVAGRGTVVTGSVYSGHVQAGDVLELWPGPLRCRVRGLQTHGDDREQLQVGQRAAINLSGLEREQVERGCELAAEGAMTQTQVIDVRLTLVRSNRRPLPAYRSVRLCLGTREVLAKVVPLDRSQAILPGSSAFAQLRSEEPLVAAHGQRFVLRDETARRTLGGGVVLRVAGRRRSLDLERDRVGLERLWNGSDADRLAETLRSEGTGNLSDAALSIRSGVPLTKIKDARTELESGGFWLEIPGTGRRVIRDLWEQWQNRGCQYLERFHRLHAGEVGCPIDVLVGWLERRSEKRLGRPLLEGLVKSGRVKLLGEFACLARFAPAMSAQDEKALAAMLTIFESAEFQPPGLDDVAVQTRSTPERIQKLVRVAVSTRQLVEVAKGMFLHGTFESRMREQVTTLLEKTGGATVSEIKDVLGTSRKFAVPFVEYMDRIGFTIREGDVRRLKLKIS